MENKLIAIKYITSITEEQYYPHFTNHIIKDLYLVVFNILNTNILYFNQIFSRLMRLTFPPL